MATTKVHSQPQPQWPFATKRLPVVKESSCPPMAPYPDTFRPVAAYPDTALVPSLGAFFRSTDVIYGLNHAIYHN